MSSSNGPYYLDPELGQSAAPDAQMYALADGALQAHQEQHHLAGLVQAATAAADHEVQDNLHAHDPELDPSSRRRVTRKRRRGQEDTGDRPDGEGSGEGGGESPPLLSSASALFRRPSKTAKKYTRPPMSKLFSSLELAPDKFLQLQSAAKNYMLNPDVPDRRDTVGQRGKGDSELVKLRLWNCVKDFLENQGIGTQFFGPDVPGDEGQQRTMIWPRDKNSIISAVTPLLRRMVTNERQRQYAVETRKGGATNAAAATACLIRPPESDTLPRPANADNRLLDEEKSLFELTTGEKQEQYVVGDTYDWPMLRPHLMMVIQQTGLPEDDLRQVVASISYHLRYTHREGFMIHKTVCSGTCPDQFVGRMIGTGKLERGPWQQLCKATQQEKRASIKTVLREIFDIIQAVISVGEAPLVGIGPLVPTLVMPSTEDAGRAGSGGKDSTTHVELILKVSVLRNGQRAFPRRDIQAHSVPYLHSIVQEALGPLGPNSLGAPPKVKVLSPEGLVAVEDDATWHHVVKMASNTVWMDHEMRMILELQ